MTALLVSDMHFMELLEAEIHLPFLAMTISPFLTIPTSYQAEEHNSSKHNTLKTLLYSDITLRVKVSNEKIQGASWQFATELIKKRNHCGPPQKLLHYYEVPVLNLGLACIHRTL